MAMQGHRAIDLYNNRAAPVMGTPKGAPLLRSDPSAASCAPTGFARFDEKSKRANELFWFNILSMNGLDYGSKLESELTPISRIQHFHR